MKHAVLFCVSGFAAVATYLRCDPSSPDTWLVAEQRTPRDDPDRLRRIIREYDGMLANPWGHWDDVTLENIRRRRVEVVELLDARGEPLQ